MRVNSQPVQVIETVYKFPFGRIPLIAKENDNTIFSVTNIIMYFNNCMQMYAISGGSILKTKSAR